jgi:mono/diheme cytochrome c family protein
MFKSIATMGISLLASFSSAFAGASEGKTLFGEKCQTCHGPNGEGKPAVAKVMKVVIPPLGSKEVQAKSDADLKKTITAGQGKMKPVAGLNAKQADDVIAYVRTLKL